MLKVLYLAHDLADPAIRRRMLVLEAGGADVTLAGFRRGAAAPEDTRAIELGVTRDGRFVQRIAAVAKSAMRLGAKLRGAAKPDVIIARNLEMLALANRANAVFGGKVPIVYECLDIHRLLLRQDAVGRILRGAEHALGRKISLLITSSPAFIENYFRPLSRLEAPILLLENQVVALDDDRTASLPAARPPLSGQPFKIGWFGALRCRKSLHLLADFSRAMNGKFEVVLRGRPAYSEFEDFDGFVRNEPFMTYQGPYRNPEDLADIYNEVQFSWAIDFFEEGLNSSWLLPNRLYEGCRYGTVPIAMRGTETARYSGARGLGLVLDHADAATLATLLSTMTAEHYLSEFDRVAATDPRQWTFDRGDARALVTRLSELRTQAAPTGPLLQDLHQTQSNKGGLL